VSGAVELVAVSVVDEDKTSTLCGGVAEDSFPEFGLEACPRAASGNLSATACTGVRGGVGRERA
jgi:hypothetical protein